MKEGTNNRGLGKNYEHHKLDVALKEKNSSVHVSVENMQLATL